MIKNKSAQYWRNKAILFEGLYNQEKSFSASNASILLKVDQNKQELNMRMTDKNLSTCYALTARERKLTEDLIKVKDCRDLLKDTLAHIIRKK